MIASHVESARAQQIERAQPAGVPETDRATAPSVGVLVVDDEPCVREVLHVGMRRQGFTVWLAANGQEALDLYRLHHQDIDVVLLDVLLPGLDGPRTLAALQELNPRIRCCFMSGDLGSHTAEKLQMQGAAAVLRKPFQLAEVARALWELVRTGVLSASTLQRIPIYQ